MSRKDKFCKLRNDRIGQRDTVAQWFSDVFKAVSDELPDNLRPSYGGSFDTNTIKVGPSEWTEVDWTSLAMAESTSAAKVGPSFALYLEGDCFDTNHYPFDSENVLFEVAWHFKLPKCLQPKEWEDHNYLLQRIQKALNETDEDLGKKLKVLEYPNSSKREFSDQEPFYLCSYPRDPSGFYRRNRNVIYLCFWGPATDKGKLKDSREVAQLILSYLDSLHKLKLFLSGFLCDQLEPPSLTKEAVTGWCGELLVWTLLGTTEGYLEWFGGRECSFDFKYRSRIVEVKSSLHDFPVHPIFTLSEVRVALTHRDAYDVYLVNISETFRDNVFRILKTKSGLPPPSHINATDDAWAKSIEKTFGIKICQKQYDELREVISSIDPNRDRNSIKLGEVPIEHLETMSFAKFIDAYGVIGTCPLPMLRTDLLLNNDE